MANRLITDNVSEPLNGAKSAKIDIDTGMGHLTIDRLDGGGEVLASGTLQHFEKQGLPTCTLDSSNGRATLTLKGGGTGQPWFRFPWAACGGAYEWQIHLNPAVSCDITAHSSGGNLKLDLAGMAVTGLTAETAGGNMDVVLPDNAGNLNIAARSGGGNVNIEMGNGTTGDNTVTAKSGAGKVAVHVPEGMAARIHTATGMGKVMVDSRFSQVDKNTYQSSDYDSAANKVEITVNSGAGNVSVSTK